MKPGDKVISSMGLHGWLVSLERNQDGYLLIERVDGMGNSDNFKGADGLIKRAGYIPRKESAYWFTKTAVLVSESYPAQSELHTNYSVTKKPKKGSVKIGDVYIVPEV